MNTKAIEAAAAILSRYLGDAPTAPQASYTLPASTLPGTLIPRARPGAIIIPGTLDS